MEKKLLPQFLNNLQLNLKQRNFMNVMQWLMRYYD